MTEFAPIPGTRIIGLGHRARHGKDTAAQILVETYRQDVQRFAFADDLYAVCRVVHGMRGKDARLLQKVGVAYRECDPDVWIRPVHTKILEARPRVAVITDVRFPNEMDFVRALGGTCWRVTRRMANGAAFVDASRPATHISEVALADAAWDRELENPDGRLDLFRQRVLDAYLS